MLHMLLLPFLPIMALIVQNSINLHHMLEYRRDSAAIGMKVDGTTALGILKWRMAKYFKYFIIGINWKPFKIPSYFNGLTSEKFITDLQRERAEVAFYIFTNGSQTLEMNLTTRKVIFSALLNLTILEQITLT